MSGNGSVASTSDANTKLTIAPGETVNLQWSYNYRGCPKSATASVTNNRVVPVARPSISCKPTLTLDANSLQSGETGWWTSANESVTSFTGGQWTSPDGSTYKGADRTMYNATVAGLQPGVNKFKWHLDNGICKDEVAVLYLFGSKC